MGSFAASFRLARRLAARRKARNALVATMIALPVAGMIAGAVVVQSGVPTLDEYLDYTLGGAEAQLVIVGPPGPRVQLPLDPWSTSEGGAADTGRELVTDPRSHLPRGTELLRVERGYATVQTDDARASVDLIAGEVWHPALSGAYDLIDGRAPRTEGEVLVTPALFDALDIALGDRLDAVSPRGVWTVVGTLREADEANTATTIFVSPGVIPEPEDPLEAATVWYVVGTPLDWEAVTDLNTHGIGVLSRAVAAEFPDAWDQANWRQASANAMLAVLAMAAGFGAFQVGLLAGAAFAVGARQEQRLLALVATTGAERRVLLRIVSLGGLVVGLVAAAFALPVGIGAGWLFLELSTSGSAADYPALHIPWSVIAGIALSAAVVGWIAAAVPARAASRVNLMRALRGARTPTPPSRRVPVRGLVMTALAAAVTLGGGLLVRASWQLSQDARDSGDTAYDPVPGIVMNTAGTAVIVIGGAGVIIGALLCCGAVLRLLARLLGRGGPAARIATRDLERNRSRAVPAIAASLSVTFVFAIIISVMHTIDTQQLVGYRWTLPPDHARLSLAKEVDWDSGTVEWSSAADARRATAALAATLPIEESRVISGALEWFPFSDAGGGVEAGESRPLPRLEVPRDSVCPMVVLGDPRSPYYEPAAEEDLRGSDPRCIETGNLNAANAFDPKMYVGSAADLEMLLGESLAPDTRVALAADVPIVLMPHYLDEAGRIRIAWYASDVAPADEVRVESPSAHLVAPRSASPAYYGLFLSPKAADELGIEYRPLSIHVRLTELPNESQLYEAYRAVPLAMGASSANLYIERGPSRLDPVIVWSLLGGAGLITLAGALAALGLARIEGRADDATLSAVGAGRGMRRRIAFVQAVVILGTGGLLGTVASLVPLTATAWGIASFELVPPWEQLAVLAIALPLIGGVLAFTITRPAPIVRARAPIA